MIREVRRSNKNTLSGLHLDAIAQQVKELIEQRERKQARTTTSGGGGGGGGGGAGGGSQAPKGAGKLSNKTRSVEKKGGGGKVS